MPDGRVLELGRRTLVVGIVNVTPDSFSDGGVRLDPETAVADALGMVADGADILDIGGESTRPGAPEVSASDEWARVEPVIKALAREAGVPLSIDTTKAFVAERALEAGATIVNDVSALAWDPALAGVVARRQAAIILMHIRGRPATMYEEARYDDVVAEVVAELTRSGASAEAAGIARERIIYDPGFGFAKRATHSLELLAGFSRLQALGRPLLAGPSRKSFLGTATGDLPPSGRVWATAAAVTASILAGAHLVRVHDVKPMVQVARTADAILAARREGSV